jgi:hypothetical protein
VKTLRIESVMVLAVLKTVQVYVAMRMVWQNSRNKERKIRELYSIKVVIKNISIRYGRN